MTEDHEMLAENLELSRDNNRILHKMLRTARWGMFFGLIKWVIIVGGAIGLYYFLQPFLEAVVKTYNALPGLEDLPFFQ